MKAYKVELLIIDHDKCGADGIKNVLESAGYPNRCIYPRVQSVEERDIGEWTDEHPLNHSDKVKAEYARLFATSAAPLAWIYEDTLPEGYPYDAMFGHSAIRDGVRMFPVFGPASAAATQQVDGGALDDDDMGALIRCAEAFDRIASKQTQTASDRLFANTRAKAMNVNDAAELASAMAPTLRRLHAKLDTPPPAPQEAGECERLRTIARDATDAATSLQKQVLQLQREASAAAGGWPNDAEPDFFVEIVIDKDRGGAKLQYALPGFGGKRELGKYACYRITPPPTQEQT